MMLARSSLFWIMALTLSSCASARDDLPANWRISCVDKAVLGSPGVAVSKNLVLAAYRNYYETPYLRSVSPLIPERSIRDPGGQRTLLIFRIDGAEDISIVYVASADRLVDRFVASGMRC